MGFEQVHRLNQEKRAGAFEVLSNISRNIAAADQDSSVFYDFICGQLGLLGIKNIFLATYEEITDAVRINFAATEGKKVDVSEEEGRGLQGEDHEKLKRAIKDGSALLLNSREEVEENGFSSVLSDNTGKVVNACLSVPLTGGKLPGILVQYLCGDSNIFGKNEDDEMILQSIANMIVIAIDKKRVKKERNQLRYLIDNIPGCYIYIKDLESRFVVANTAVAQVMRQKSPKDVIGQSDFDFYSDKEEAQHYYDDEQKIIQTGESVKNIEEWSKDLEGNDRVTLTTKDVFRNSDGDIIGTFGIGRDVTELVLAERALEKEKNLLRTLIDSVPDHIYAKDTAHRFILANKTVLRFARISTQEEIIGKRDKDFFRPELAEKYEAKEQEILDSGKGAGYEELIEHPSTGKKINLLTIKEPLRNDDGKVIGLVGINRDITRIKQFQNRLERLIHLAGELTALREDEFDIERCERQVADFIYNNASELMDTANMYIAVYHKEEDLITFPLKFLNKGEENYVKPRMFSTGKGKTESIIRSKRYLLIKTRCEDEEWNRNNINYMKNIKYVSSWIGVPIKLHDKVLGVIATYNEKEENLYTEEDVELLESLGSLVAVALENLRLYSEKEQQTKKLRKAQHKISRYHELTTRSRLAADFMHRLNNLAGTIPIWAELIEEHTNKLVAHIKEDTRRLLQEAKIPSYSEEDINIKDMLETILNQVRVQYCQNKNIKINDQEISNDLCLVRGVYYSLANSIFSIIENGIEAIIAKKTPGELTVKAENCQNRPAVLIEIRDTGEGISKDDIPKLFTFSFSTKPPKEGASERGYGLWSAKLDIKTFKGTIDLMETNEGYGSTFRITLPRK